MNKKVFLFLIAFFVFCFLTNSVFAASKELEDYLFQYEKYDDIYDQFEISRDKFLTYKILSAREQAADATKKLLLQRNQVLRTYFLVLKNKLRTTPGVIKPETKDNLISQLDKKIIWLKEESEEVNGLSSTSLDDLFILSDRVEEKEEELKRIAYQSLGEVLLGKIRSLQQESVATSTLLKEDIFEKKEATQAAQLNLWIKEITVKNYLAQKEIEAAEINLWNLQSAKKETDMIKYFNNLKTDVDDAKLYLSQAVAFQKEILVQLNYD